MTSSSICVQCYEEGWRKTVPSDIHQMWFIQKGGRDEMPAVQGFLRSATSYLAFSKFISGSVFRRLAVSWRRLRVRLFLDVQWNVAAWMTHSFTSHIYVGPHRSIFEGTFIVTMHNRGFAHDFVTQWKYVVNRIPNFALSINVLMQIM